MSAATDEVMLERVYVWQWPVRLSHWLIVGSLAVLAITGLYIGNPFLPVSGEATRHFMMGTIKSVHFGAAIAFTIAVITRVIWMFGGNPYARWHQFVPVSRRRIRGLFNTIAFYAFLKRDSPAFVGHNPLAGIVYTVVFCIYFVMIATGFGLAGANAYVGSWLHVCAPLASLFGGLQMARFIHHIGMWLLIGFVAHHVWSAFLIGNVERSGLMDSIFSGYKVLLPDIARRVRRRIAGDV